MPEHSGDQNTTAMLLLRAQGGDARARTALVARIEPLLRRFAHARLPPALRASEDTGDLVQRTWLRVLDRLDEIGAREPGAFFAYLRAALLNALRESLRRDQRRPETTLDEREHAPLPGDGGLPLEDWVEYERSLERLPPERRALVLMRYEFGMSFAEIGAELGASPDAVRVRLRRVLEELADDVAG